MTKEQAAGACASWACQEVGCDQIWLLERERCGLQSVDSTTRGLRTVVAQTSKQGIKDTVL